MKTLSLSTLAIAALASLSFACAKYWLNFLPYYPNSPDITAARFDLIDSCVTPGQAHDDVSVSVSLYRNEFNRHDVDFHVNFPAERQTSGVCASWYNQTIARGHFASSSADSWAQSPDELNLALRGNLHIFFADGTERVHQVVLGQGHIDGGIFTTPTKYAVNTSLHH